ncbi:NAD-dependent epimerase/dehydratase family protein [Algoriphagus aestuariicola]|uniref:NAD-dependent epimerase/dehydratase family protein n=1 Tax=Algoriphagus aestuariicola TaxID=1852016 RepID=A0ABS3BNV2_9BACT|nr:NAD-dependent epimerase/dehydratase family protein [Algoriphagus aestuariicola]MBN7799926.1 NAD-dependent epimerase/dehydratase family protein [Algoriphagus aestuariicola]
MLLLGGSGYIGTHLSRKLKSNGFSKVFVGSRNSSGTGGVGLDITDVSSVRQIKAGNFDFIVNLTGQISRPIDACLNQNTLGIQNLIAACGEHSTLVHLSSVGVYGSGESVDESSPCNPETPYSALKLAAENLLVNGLDQHQRLIVRLSNIYGSSQPKGVFAYLKKSALSDAFLEFNNDGTLVRSFLHVEDLVSGLLALLEKNEEIQSPIVNIVGKDRYTVTQLIELFEGKFHVSYRKQFDPIKPYDNMLSISDRIFRQMTDFKEQYSLDTYIDELVDHAN